MKLIVNGQTLDAAAPTLSTLLSELGYEGEWYATAVNGEFVPSEDRNRAQLSEGDRIEILTPRQGG